MAIASVVSILMRHFRLEIFSPTKAHGFAYFWTTAENYTVPACVWYSGPIGV